MSWRGRLLLDLAGSFLVVLWCLAYIGLAACIHPHKTVAAMSAAHPPVEWLALVLMLPAGAGLLGVFRLFRRSFVLWLSERG